MPTPSTTEPTNEFDYDALLAALAEAQAQGNEPNLVVCRSVEEAYALAAWCEENGLG